MSNPAESSAASEIDVRLIPKPQRHPLIFEAYGQLAVGESFVLLNDHEPKHLREEFDLELGGSFTWEPEISGEAQNTENAASTESAASTDYRVRITKTARTALPRVVADTSALASAAQADAAGSIWQLEPAARELDSNIIALAAGAEIKVHDGPDLDVLFLILHGAGELETEVSSITLKVGELVWLPKTSRRRIIAGPEGLRYLTVHRRKPTLGITAAPTLRMAL